LETFDKNAHYLIFLIVKFSILKLETFDKNAHYWIFLIVKFSILTQIQFLHNNFSDPLYWPVAMWLAMPGAVLDPGMVVMSLWNFGKRIVCTFIKRRDYP
jgi:hypothetical protein